MSKPQKSDRDKKIKGVPSGDMLASPSKLARYQSPKVNSRNAAKDAHLNSRPSTAVKIDHNSGRPSTATNK